MLVTFSSLDQRGEFEACGSRHLNVQNDRREFVMEEGQKRVICRTRSNEGATTRRENCFEGIKIPLFVVYQKQLNDIIHSKAFSTGHPVKPWQPTVGPRCKDRTQAQNF